MPISVQFVLGYRNVTITDRVYPARRWFLGILMDKVNLTCTGCTIVLMCTFSVVTADTTWLIDWLTFAMWEGKSHFLMQKNQSVLQGESMATNNYCLAQGEEPYFCEWRLSLHWVKYNYTRDDSTELLWPGLDNYNDRTFLRFLHFFFLGGGDQRKKMLSNMDNPSNSHKKLQRLANSRGGTQCGALQACGQEIGEWWSREAQVGALRPGTKGTGSRRNQGRKNRRPQAYSLSTRVEDWRLDTSSNLPIFYFLISGFLF